VRQLITRIDDDLHGRLKARAKERGTSVNALVTEILEEAVPDESPRERFRRLLKQHDLLVEEEPNPDAPSREELMEMLRGDAGRAVLEAFEEDRKRR